MSYLFDESQPIYLQLIKIFKIKIANGTWQAGQKIDSVRNLALDFDVNPNTVQRALAELEILELAYSQRTSGRFVTEDQVLIDSLKHEMAKNKTQDFVLQMQAIKISDQQIKELIEQIITELADKQKAEE